MGKRSREKWERKEEGVAQEKEKISEFQTGLEKTCLFVITWAAYALLFTPLIVATQFFFPFVAPKTTFFRIVVEIIFAAYLFLVISNTRYRPKINALTLAITLFLAVFVLSSFLGINLGRSFWSTYERMTGIWTMLHLYAFFIVIYSCFKERKDWERIFGVAVLVGALLSIYSLQGTQISTRGGGTIGNTSFMAAFLLFPVFFAIVLFLANFLKKENWPLFWQIFSGISLAIMIPALLLSTARGAVAVFWVGLFLIGWGYFLFSKKKILKRMGWGLSIALVVMAIGILVLQPIFIKNKIQQTLAEMKPRFTIWQIGFESWQERPVLGWGPENFNTAFARHFNPCLITGECGSEIWFDRAHNIVLDTLATTGLMGLLAYLAIFGVAIFGLFKTLPKIVDQRNIFFPVGMIALLIIYFLQNLLVFDMINSYLMFFLSLAFISFLITPRAREEIKRRRVHPVFGISVILLTIFFLWAGNIKPLAAGHYIVATVASQDINKGMEYFQKSLDSWMNKYETREHFAQKMGRTASQSVPQEQQPLFNKAFELAAAEMEKGIQENSLDFRPHLFLGRLYTAFYQFSGLEEKLLLAQKTLEKAIELSPAHMQGYWYLAEVKLAQGKNEEAIQLLQKSIELEPRWPNSYWYLALTYKIAGEFQKAKEELIEAEEAGYNWKNNIQDLKRAIEIYSVLQDDSSLVPLYLLATELNPQDVQLWASLAASYANLGQFEKAREAAGKIGEINPDLKPRMEEFLKTLPQQ